MKTSRRKFLAVAAGAGAAVVGKIPAHTPLFGEVTPLLHAGDRIVLNFTTYMTIPLCGVGMAALKAFAEFESAQVAMATRRLYETKTE